MDGGENRVPGEGHVPDCSCLLQTTQNGGDYMISCIIYTAHTENISYHHMLLPLAPHMVHSGCT